MSKGRIALMIGALVLIVYAASAPYITVHQMKSAAEARDGEALSEHIDFPSVRQSIKDQMNAVFAMRMAENEDTKDSPYSVLGVAMAGLVIDRMVDAYVTPAGITRLMAGEQPARGDGLRGRAPDDPERKPFLNASMSYASLDKFVVKVRGEDAWEGQFILRRRGLGWKLTEIVLPLE